MADALTVGLGHLLVKALGDPDEMFWWDKRYGGTWPEGKALSEGGSGGFDIMNWVINNPDKVNAYINNPDGSPRTIDFPLDIDYELPEFSEVRADLSNPFDLTVAAKKIAHHGEPSKMAGGSIMDTPPRACIFSTPENPNSACGNCYACKGNHRFNSKQASMWRTLDRLLNDPIPTTAAYADTVLPQSLLMRGSRRDKPVARVNTSGDALGAGGLAAPDAVARMNPSMDFWLATRQYPFVRDLLDARGWEDDAFAPNMAVNVSLPGKMTPNDVVPGTEWKGRDPLGNMHTVDLYELGQHPAIDWTTYDAFDNQTTICPATIPGNPRKCDEVYDPLTNTMKCRACYRRGTNVGYMDHDDPLSQMPPTMLEILWDNLKRRVG